MRKNSKGRKRKEKSKADCEIRRNGKRKKRKATKNRKWYKIKLMAGNFKEYGM